MALGFVEGVVLLTHRALAGHGPREYCPECPFVACRHCDDVGRPGEDHTCPCPHSDADCAEHPEPTEATSNEDAPGLDVGADAPTSVGAEQTEEA